MGGDGMGAMAAAIFGAMALMLIAGFVIAFFIGRWLARNAAPGKRLAISLTAAIVGVGIGLLAVTATFFESSWSPPPKLYITVPPRFAHGEAIFIEDAARGAPLTWHGVEIPFMGKTARITLGPSGVARVKSFGDMAGRGDLAVQWSDGADANGYAGGPGPKALGASGFIILSRGAWAPGRFEPPMEDAALAAYVRQREGGK